MNEAIPQLEAGLSTNDGGLYEPLEHAWRQWKPGNAPPFWLDFIPSPGAACEPEHVYALVQVDIDFRARAGLPGLLQERHFLQPRLQMEDARVSPARQLELIRRDYQQRWKQGDRVSRHAYEDAFPDHATAIHDLNVPWTCPLCRHRDNSAAEGMQGLRCGGCGNDFTIDDIFRSQASRPVQEGLDLRKYELLDALGAGGMGEVYRVLDPGLGRDLAIKIMRAEMQMDPAAEPRFIREARVTGSLQHPGIVPIHNLGRLPDGRLFFTMKLVRGETLQNLLEAGETTRRAKLPEWLGIFEKVCQAVAYAHTRHVIHRDLKPANVMVGNFGEVQVMDWGLAKVLTSGGTTDPSGAFPAPVPFMPEEDAAIAETLRSPTTTLGGQPNLSRAGTAMGTPAFMPPEQARGQIDQVDQRSDVFALGAMLCTLLTGQPPYWGEKFDEVFEKARNGNLTEALTRLDQCGADAELIALGKECLRPEREQRPRNAEQVAQRVHAYQAGVQERLRRAEIEKETAQVKVAEERRRRKVSLALAGLVVVFLLGLGGAALWYQQHQAERQNQAQRLGGGVNASLEDAERVIDDLYARLADVKKVRVLLGDLRIWRGLLDQAQASWQQAKGLAESDPTWLDAAVLERKTAVKARLDEAERHLAFATTLERIRQDSMSSVGGSYDTVEASRRFEKAFAEQGWYLFQGEIDDTAERMRRSPIRFVLVDGMDNLGVNLNQKAATRVLAIARQVDPDPWRDAVRHVIHPKDFDKMNALVENIDYETQPPRLLSVLAYRYRSNGGDGGAIVRKAILHYPGDFQLHLTAGTLSTDPRERVAHFRAALSLRPDNDMGYIWLGSALVDLGDYDAAVDYLRKGARLVNSYSWSHALLAHAYFKQGNLDEAIRCVREAIRLEPDTAYFHQLLANALSRQGDQAGADVARKRSQELLSKESVVHSLDEEVRHVVDLDVLRAGVSGKLNASLPRDRPTLGRGYRRVYAVRLKAGKVYQFDLSATFDPMLRIEDTKDRVLAFNDDITPPKMVNARIVFRPETSEVFKLVVTSYHDDTTGSYHLQLRDAVEVEPARTFEGVLAESKLDYKGAFLSVHKVNLTAGRSYVIQLESEVFDTRLLLPGLVEGDGQRDGTSSRARLDFTPDRTGEFKVVVTSQTPRQTGAYTTRITSFAPKVSPAK